MKFRIGKNEKWILAEAYRREMEKDSDPFTQFMGYKYLHKYEVLENYYGLERVSGDCRGQIYFKGNVYTGCPDSQEKKRNNAAVSYAKSIRTLREKGLIGVEKGRKANMDGIFLTDKGMRRAEMLKVNDKLGDVNIIGINVNTEC